MSGPGHPAPGFRSEADIESPKLSILPGEGATFPFDPPFGTLNLGTHSSLLLPPEVWSILHPKQGTLSSSLSVAVVCPYLEVPREVVGPRFTKYMRNPPLILLNTFPRELSLQVTLTYES